MNKNITSIVIIGIMLATQLYFTTVNRQKWVDIERVLQNRIIKEQLEEHEYIFVNKKNN